MSVQPSIQRQPTFEVPKCIECHRTGHKCTPTQRTWPGERCERCLRHNLPCSEGVVARFPVSQSQHSSLQSQNSQANDAQLPAALQRQESRPRAQQNPKHAQVARAGVAKRIQQPVRPGLQQTPSGDSQGIQSSQPEPLKNVANQVREQVREQRSSNMRHYSLEDINAVTEKKDEPSAQSIWATRRHDAHELVKIQEREEMARNVAAERAAALENERREQERLDMAQEDLARANAVGREQDRLDREDRANREQERLNAQRKLEQRVRQPQFIDPQAQYRESNRQSELSQEMPNLDRRSSAPVTKEESMPNSASNTPPAAHRNSFRRLLPWVKNSHNNVSPQVTPETTPSKPRQESIHNSMDSFEDIEVPVPPPLKPKRSKSPTKKRPKDREKDMKKYQSKDMAGLAPIHLAAQTGDSNMLLALIQLGADLNLMTGSGLTCLHLAILQKHPQIIQILLEHGISLQQKTGDDISPLMLACRSRDNLGLIEMLVLAGAHVDREILFEAVESGDVELVKVLLKGRVDVNARDSKGLAVVHRAVMRGDVEMVKVLVNAGADPNDVVAA